MEQTTQALFVVPVAMEESGPNVDLFTFATRAEAEAFAARVAEAGFDFIDVGEVQEVRPAGTVDSAFDEFDSIFGFGAE